MEHNVRTTRYYVRQDGVGQENVSQYHREPTPKQQQYRCEGPQVASGSERGQRLYYVQHDSPPVHDDDRFVSQQIFGDAELRVAMEGGERVRYFAAAAAPGVAAPAGRSMHHQHFDGNPRCSSAEVADALARRILGDRDHAIGRLADVERALEEQKREASIVEEALHSESQSMRHDYEQQLHFAEMMLTDAAHKNEMLRQRVSQLEGCLLRLMATAPEPDVKVPTEPEAESAFGLTKTKEAIEEAVREAASLPADERRKKLKALRLKWHPDKHEVLREMAEEVTKIINEAIEKMVTDEPTGDDSALAAAPAVPAS